VDAGVTLVHGVLKREGRGNGERERMREMAGEDGWTWGGWIQFPRHFGTTHIADQLQRRLLAVSLHALAAAGAVPPGGEGVPVFFCDEGNGRTVGRRRGRGKRRLKNAPRLPAARLLRRCPPAPALVAGREGYSGGLGLRRAP